MTKLTEQQARAYRLSRKDIADVGEMILMALARDGKTVTLTMPAAEARALADAAETAMEMRDASGRPTIPPVLMALAGGAAEKMRAQLWG